MVDKLNAEHFTLINAYGADGKFSKEELDALKMKGVNEEILKELSGAKSQAEVGDIVSKYLHAEVKPEEKPNNFVSMLLFAGKILSIPLLLFGSCTTEMNQTMHLNVPINSDSSNQEIIDELKKIHGELTAIKNNQESLQKTVDAMAQTLIDINVGVDRMVDILEALGADVATIAATLAANGVKVDEILSAIYSNNELSEANNELLKQILTKISTIEANDKEGKDLLNKILAKVTESVENQNEMKTENQAFYQAVLDKMGNLDSGMKEGLNKVLEAIDNNTLTDKEILAKLTDLISKFGNLSAGQETDLTVVVNAINALGGDLNAILAEIQKGNSQLEAIREAIEKNNEIAQGTQDAVNNLAAQNNKDHETIIALMTKLLENDANDAATMDDIKAILNEIKTNTKGNWDTSLRIEDKLNLVAQTINVILETQKELGDDTKAVLLQILAKIPDGCNCETVDLTVIIEKLDKLIEATEEGRNDPKHEGILDDLDDLLG